MLFGPAGKLGHRHLVKHLLQHGGGRRGALQQRGGEGVGVGIEADHPSGVVCICIFIHGLLWLSRRTETGQAMTCTQVCGAVPR